MWNLTVSQRLQMLHLASAWAYSLLLGLQHHHRVTGDHMLHINICPSCSFSPWHFSILLCYISLTLPSTGVMTYITTPLKPLGTTISSQYWWNHQFSDLQTTTQAPVKLRKELKRSGSLKINHHILIWLFFFYITALLHRFIFDILEGLYIFRLFI